ncbi:CD276 antigen-like [Chanos chanos]|uniref:CD276 antigen-like n=1 Tax=Chanos chanos TaxID=29144 RepID=A0A6J2WFT6_CHACN|nr:CD276 antigen-like [Chanos chanos]
MACVTVAAFEVKTPQRQVTAVRGRPALLQCLFTPGSDSSLNDLVITWQRADSSRVLHSFYYGVDQLGQQSSHYHNRTRMNSSELLTGNASLLLFDVGPSDEGQHMCTVSNSKGTDKAVVQLNYGAFYTEPRLTIAIDSANLIIQYESEGYPEPDIEWKDLSGQNLTHKSQILQDNQDQGLLKLNTLLTADPSQGVNFTFTLRNPLLHQVLERIVTLHHVFQKDHGTCPRERLAILSPILLFFLIIFVLLCPAIGKKVAK